jgi:transposase-like protein
MRVKKSPQQSGTGKRPGPYRYYPKSLRLRTVRLCIEDGLPLSVVSTETGVGNNTVRRWVERYKEFGEAGLESRHPGGGGKRLPAAIREKIIETKKANPEAGSRRISAFLRRMLLLPASAETVRKTLQLYKILPQEKIAPQ